MAWFLLNTSCISSQDQGGVSLEVYCSEKRLSEQLNGKSTQERRSWPDKRMVCYRPFPSGMTSPLSDWITRKRESISGSCNQSAQTLQSQEASPVRTSALREKARELKDLVQDFGVRCAESLLRFDPGTSSWKTPQCLLFEDSSESLPTLPKYGIALRGVLWELPMLERIIRETGFGASEPRRNTSTGKEIHIPTPTVMDAMRGGGRSITTDENFRGIGLKHLVEDIPHRMWPETADSTPPHTHRRESEISDADDDRLQGRDQRQREVAERRIRQDGRPDAYGPSYGGRRMTFPTPIAHDAQPAVNGHVLVRTDGKSRLDALNNFVKWGIEE